MSWVKERQAWFTIGGILVLLIGGTVYVMLNMDFSFVSLGGITLAVLLLIALVYTLGAALGNYVVFRSLGYKTSFLRLYLVSYAGLASLFSMPFKMGVPVWVVLCKAFLDIPPAASSAQVFLVTSISVFFSSLLSILGIGLLFQKRDAYSFLVLAYTLILLIAVTLVLDLRRIEPLLSGWPDWMRKWGQRVLRFALEFQQLIRQVSKAWLLAAVGLHLIRLWLRAVCLYIVFYSLGSTVPLSKILLMQAASGLAGWISMLPMGIGVKDVTLVVLLAAIGVSHEIAVLGGVVDRMLWSMVPIVLGTISASILGLHKASRGGDLQIHDSETSRRK
jgi:uncharacterized protein (TIRG00374 family)